MRGGDRYPVLIRKTEPKPLRIFMQDGDKDGWPGGLELGDWWMSNQAVERALTFAGYEVNHTWGVLGHEGSHGESILPDVMRWLWKDWPKPVAAGETGNFAIQAIAQSGEDWKPIQMPRHPQVTLVDPRWSSIYASPPVVTANSTAGSLASDGEGNVYVQNPSEGAIYRIGRDNSVQAFVRVQPGDNGLAFGPDGKLYVAETSTGTILAFDPGGQRTIVATGIAAN